MSIRNHLVIIYCTAVAFSVLYATQPMLPLLAEHWQRPANDLALITTATMIPLALGPLFYGYVLEHVSTKHMLGIGFALLTLTQAVLSRGPGYTTFIALRALEGLMLPAILTALMTYSSALGGSAHARRNITIYIAATILGGYLGRAITGILTDLVGWQGALAFWAGAAFLAGVLIAGLQADPRLRLGKVRLAEFRGLISRPVFAEGFASAFMLFFVFAAMLNFLPFQMRANDPDISQSAIGLVYTGYLIGIAVSLSSLRLIRWFGGERRLLIVGTLIYLLGTAAFGLPGNDMAYVAMMIFAAGMFTLHSVLSAFLNHLEERRKGLVNGLYVSAYYSGGALGSYLPGFIYEAHGWDAMISALLGLLLLLLALMLSMRSAPGG